MLVALMGVQHRRAAMHETTRFDQADFSQGKKGLSWHGSEGVTKDGVDFCVVAVVRLE